MSGNDERDRENALGDELDDRMFEQLFASLDDVHASDELKASTLVSIFDELDDEGETSKLDMPAYSSAEEPVGRPQLTLVSGGGASTAGTARPLARRMRNDSWKLRIAAAILVVALGVGGGVAYAVPASHVLVTIDNTTFDLRVNVFGATIAASANTDEGKVAINAASVYNRGFEDAFDRLLDAYQKRDAGESLPTVEVRVEERFGGQGERISQEANRILERRTEKREQVPEAGPVVETSQEFDAQSPTGPGQTPSDSNASPGQETAGQAPDRQKPFDQEPTEQPQTSESDKLQPSNEEGAAEPMPSRPSEPESVSAPSTEAEPTPETRPTQNPSDSQQKEDVAGAAGQPGEQPMPNAAPRDPHRS